MCACERSNWRSGQLQMAEDQRSQPSYLGALVIAVCASWIVAEIRGSKSNRGTISVSGPLVGVEPFDVNFTQSGSSVTVTPKST